MPAFTCKWTQVQEQGDSAVTDEHVVLQYVVHLLSQCVSVRIRIPLHLTNFLCTLILLVAKLFLDVFSLKLVQT